MSKTTTELPFTELVERLQEIARIDSTNDSGRARGAINHAYTKELPREEDWSFLLVSSAISCVAKYDAGTVTATTQDTTVTFSAAATITAGMTGRKIKFTGNPDVYDFTRTGDTAGTIAPQLSGDANITAGAYVIFQPRYQLSSTFERFPKNGGLQLFQGGVPTILPETPIQEYYSDYTSSPGTPATCRVVDNVGTDGVPYVEVAPPPSKAVNLPYDYFRKLLPLRETTGGVATIAAGATAVTGQSGTLFTEAQSGWYFRINAFGTGEDSEWYRVLAVTHNSALVLQTAFGLSGATSANYTLCAAPAIPARLHDAILFKGVQLVTADQNDPLFQFYGGLYAKSIVDAKRLFKTRVYSQTVHTDLEEFHFRR